MNKDDDNVNTNRYISEEYMTSTYVTDDITISNFYFLESSCVTSSPKSFLM